MTEDNKTADDSNSAVKRLVMRVEKQHNIKSCINRCPFYATSMDGMECSHPFWDDKKAYDNMIIRHGGPDIPDECPLKKEDVVIEQTYSLVA